MNRPTDPKTSSWQRYFDGWPTGAIVVLSAVILASLFTPLPIGTEALPLPQVDRLQQLAALRVDRQLAIEALAGLPPAVAQLGVGLRRAGTRDAQASPSKAEHRQLRRMVKATIARHGEQPLLRLRALQSQRFLLASRAMQQRATALQARADLEALGGQLVQQGRRRGWFSDQGFLGDERTLAVLFKIHWTRITGLIKVRPFAPSVTDWKIYYRFLLSSPTQAGIDEVADAKLKMRQITELVRHDTDYPALLGLGILLRRANKRNEAAATLMTHRANNPNGNWSLLARNHLAGCAAL